MTTMTQMTTTLSTLRYTPWSEGGALGAGPLGLREEEEGGAPQ